MEFSRTQNWSADDLTDNELSAITELLRERRQFDLGQYKDRCIRRRIAKRLRICKVVDFASYLKRLCLDNDELDTLLATISIHVSQFFRNPDTYQIIEQKILPDLCTKALSCGRKELVLWSAGCASGEEPYSLSLLVDDMNCKDLDIRILATDISSEILDFAGKGVYDRNRLREVPTAVLEKYFQAQDDKFELFESIRKRVKFERLSIMAGDCFPAADLILCRNVLIYFTREEQERILYHFASVMPEYGRLVLGRAETMAGPARRYFKPEYPVERIYRRSEEPVNSSNFSETGLE